MSLPVCEVLATPGARAAPGTGPLGEFIASDGGFLGFPDP
jgi:hypothetical protein